MAFIKIRGAREHNLKNVDVDIKKDALTVITGLSGSGKSSLAFDTIYAEGQRRYVESLSAYARGFLDLMKKPDADSIEGLSPSISIEQKTTSKNPRSTVGTVTEIYDYLRLLYARIGIPYSPTTGKPIQSQTVSQMVDRIMTFDEGEKFYLLSPLARDKKGEFKKEIKALQKQGYQRIKIDGAFYEIEDVPELLKTKTHTLEVVVDRLVKKDGIEGRLASSLETALSLSNGLALTETLNGERTVFSSKFCCPETGFTIPEIEPRLFSFNNPHGACPTCAGLGIKLYIDPELVVPDGSKSLREGALAPWVSSSGDMYRWHEEALLGICERFKIDLDIPWDEISKNKQHAILYGDLASHYEGIIPNMERRFLETDSDWMRGEISRFQNNAVCETCHGDRLKKEALCIKINSLNIAEVTRFSIEKAREWFIDLPLHLSNKENEIASRILREITERLSFLCNVGLTYLTLDRIAGTLSGGEAQRIRLASQIGSGLTGVIYVLDEPSIGLHQRDNSKLIETLHHLRDLGNTIIVVEHDEETMRASDYIIDMGPKAGFHGGQITAQGTIQDILNNEKSLTGQYLSGKKEIPLPKKRRKGNGKKISLLGAKEHNLKNINVDIPLGTFTCITGVSGGGKSTLILETLYKSINNILNKTRLKTGAFDSIKGVGNIDKIIHIDQSPIGRTPRSNPATYTGIFSPIREWFASLPESKARGYKAGRFSFNVKGGRCEACKGDGLIKIEMHFLPDVYVNCDVCEGKRYNRETLEVKYKGKSIADVLDMTVNEGAEFFKNIPRIASKCHLLQKVGLGYIKLGQGATTLSGGEAQRVKLAKELSKKATGKTLYILDEPTTGLHFEDIRKLLEVLHLLVDQGNTVVVIEHNLDVIKTADYIIDLGPEGGDKGGEIVAKGTPEEIIQVKKSYTGKYLTPYLKKKS
ncbi:MAG: excinuclease ABC subunit UvrA [Alphaproteobacteria bacterium]|nr:excinuclease ABC subunit UvrA [Alphaproteobacteria bacterium]